MKAVITAAGLEKIARHLALLTIMAIVFKTSGWADTGQPAILMLAASASVLHLGARWMRLRRRGEGS
jgi:hypothetical protein